MKRLVKRCFPAYVDTRPITTRSYIEKILYMLQQSNSKYWQWIVDRMGPDPSVTDFEKLIYLCHQEHQYNTKKTNQTQKILHK